MREPTQHAVRVTDLYRIAKRTLEDDITAWKRREPWLHAATMATRLIERSPVLWRVYQAGIAAGLPSEFQTARRVRSERDRRWQRIETAARTRVARSRYPLTLRSAVIAVVSTTQGREWYRRYANASQP